MPRAAKPARLWLEPGRKDKAGRVTHAPTWIIRDGAVKRSTGCGKDDVAGAERALADYVAGRHAEEAKAPSKNKTAAETMIADVVAFYAAEAAELVARPKDMIARLERLLGFWGDKSLADINRSTCRAYVAHRGSASAARRELEDLRAAITIALEEGHCRENVKLTLPPKAPRRVAYFTRSDVAKLLWHCWTFRESQVVQRGSRKGETVVTKKRPLRHLCAFILTAVYTASRSSRIWRAGYEKVPGHPWLDLDDGIFHRMWAGEIETDKRAATVRIPDRLLRHMERWQRGPLVGGIRRPRRFLVEYRGRPADPKKALAKAMDDVFGEGHEFVRHTFRHTAVTWLMWAGEDPAKICDYASMSEKILHSVYRHAHPDTHRDIGDSFSSGRAGRKVGRTIRERHGKAA